MFREVTCLPQSHIANGIARSQALSLFLLPYHLAVSAQMLGPHKVQKDLEKPTSCGWAAHWQAQGQGESESRRAHGVTGFVVNQGGAKRQE